MPPTTKILDEVFARLLNLKLDEQTMGRLTPVIDGVLERIQDSLDLETIQGQNTLIALICSMVAHGWGLGMHPDNNPETNLDNRAIEVKVCKDILVPMKDLKSIRYVKKDSYGRVKKALFEPDQNARIRGQIDEILTKITQTKWSTEE
jgi:hypothetical protein